MDKTKEAFAEYKDVVTVCEVMEMLGLGRVAVYRLLREGIIRTIRVGKKYIIPKKREILRKTINILIIFLESDINLL